MQAEHSEEHAYLVAGQPYQALPKDLFIPPDALQVLLETFSGPLDLLLYLIRRQNLDIMDIPIVLVTEQYMQYIALMDESRMELAADYLVMAATLAEIKSRLLLPAVHEAEEDSDPRMDLVKRLQAYEQFKMAAQGLDTLPRQEREIFPVVLMPVEIPAVYQHPSVALMDIKQAMYAVLIKEDHMSHHRVMMENKTLSVRERMTVVLEKLKDGSRVEFSALYVSSEGRMGVLVSFLAILELAKQSLLIVTQATVYGPIHLQGVHHG